MVRDKANTKTVKITLTLAQYTDLDQLDERYGKDVTNKATRLITEWIIARYEAERRLAGKST